MPAQPAMSEEDVAEMSLHQIEQQQAYHLSTLAVTTRGCPCSSYDG